MRFINVVMSFSWAPLESAHAAVMNASLSADHRPGGTVVVRAYFTLA